VAFEGSQDGDRRPRVLILVENGPVPGDRRVTAEALSLFKHGYTVSVICPAEVGGTLEEPVDGVTVKRYRSMVSKGGAFSQILEYLVALIKTFWLMLELARTPGFDVIQACNPPDLFFLITWPFKLAGKRFIFDQHDLSPELYSALYERDSGFIMKVLQWTERLSYRHADVIMVPNESYKRVACLRGGVSPDDVFVVRNGPRADWPRPVAPDESLKSGSRFLVVYMGVMGYQDGVDVLINVIHTLTRKMGFTDARFALVGAGNAFEAVKKQAHALNVEEFIEFCGWVTNDEVLSRYLITADACVCPEPSSPLNDHSTFIKVMEYMSAGKPIVAFDLPETRFSAEDAALYSTPGDIDGFAAGIREVLTNESLRSRMTASAARRMESLRWESQVPALLQAYDRALAPKPRVQEQEA
jgi:glycosyltransferase involved in cell wall biosynthesis